MKEQLAENICRNGLCWYAHGVLTHGQVCAKKCHNVLFEENLVMSHSGILNVHTHLTCVYIYMYNFIYSIMGIWQISLKLVNFWLNNCHLKCWTLYQKWNQPPFTLWLNNMQFASYSWIVLMFSERIFREGWSRLKGGQQKLNYS